MKFSDRDAFYETMYFHEFAERDRLDDRFRTLLAVVAIVFGMVGFLFNTVVIGTVTIPLLFWLVYTIAIVSFAAAVICYTRAWHSQHYKALPVLEDLEAYIGELRIHYQKQADESTAEQWTEQAFDEYIRQTFITHTSFNARANDDKRYWLYYGNSFIIGAFAFCVMAFFPVSDALLH